MLSQNWLERGVLSMEKLRIDSTVVANNIAPPGDSHLLNDGVRVLRRLLSRSKDDTGIKIRFTDQRRPSKSLPFQIFNAKKSEKERLYPSLLKLARVVLKLVSRGLQSVSSGACEGEQKENWMLTVEHYQDLMLKIIDQTERRVIQKAKVHSSEKIVSLFEPHTDIIVKGFRDVQYGHKINLSSERRGFITY
jgi:IS5 family transposase